MGAKSELCEEHCLGHGELASCPSIDIGMIFSRCLQLHRRVSVGLFVGAGIILIKMGIHSEDAELRPRAKTCPQFFNSFCVRRRLSNQRVQRNLL